MSILCPKQTYEYIFHLADIHIHNDRRHVEYQSNFTKLYNMIKRDKICKNKWKALIYIAGDLFHYSKKLSPDCISIATDFLTKLSKIATVVIIAGNHDNNTKNKNIGQIDAISSIVNEINNLNKKIFYFKNSGVYHFGTNITFGLTSVFDMDIRHKREEWLDVLVHIPDDKIHDDRIKIALCHCGIDGAVAQNGYLLRGCQYKVSDFDEYDFKPLCEMNKRYSDANCKTL